MSGLRGLRRVKSRARAHLRWWWVLPIAGVHFLVHGGLFILTFGRSMSRFDSGEPAGLVERMADAMVSVLSLPLLPIALSLPSDWFSGFAGYAPLALNSLLWGVAGWLLIRFVGKRGQAAAVEPTAAPRRG